MSVPPLPDTHLVLVSNQPTPSLTPLLDPALTVRRVLLAHTPERHMHALWLARVLTPHGIETLLCPIRDGYDMPTLNQDMSALFMAIDGPAAVNITGGSKLMSLVATTEATLRGWPIYYIRQRDDSLIWVHDQDAAPHPLADSIRLPDFLAAHGIEAVGHTRTPPERQRRLARVLLQSESLREQLDRLRPVFAQLANPGLPPQHGRLRHAGALLAQLEQAGLLTQQAGHWRLIESADYNFLTGGWFEIAVFDAIERLRPPLPRLQDMCMNLRVRHADAPETTSHEEVLLNEIDIALLYDNSLHLIECKTGNLSGSAYGKPSAKDIAYQLDALSEQLGGINSRALLVSLEKLSPNMRRRAEHTGIHLIHGPQINRLSSLLLDWLRPAARATP
ncbi:MAG: DUF1887 family CARF protein [Halothiobacillaceae bacterium]|nr:DUF1887 family CARF protein [Halothiobacillaceae bacterium]